MHNSRTLSEDLEAFNIARNWCKCSPTKCCKNICVLEQCCSCAVIAIFASTFMKGKKVPSCIVVEISAVNSLTCAVKLSVSNGLQVMIPSIDNQTSTDSVADSVSLICLRSVEDELLIIQTKYSSNSSPGRMSFVRLQST